jgi:type III secretion system FlhB-like substrate exporter
VETHTLKLDLQKYRARTISQWDKLPINDKIRKRLNKKKIKMPYAQRITQLIHEYEINDLTTCIAKHCYEIVIEISPVNIDLTVTSKISKSNINTESLVTDNIHISKDHTDQISNLKDPDGSI